MKIVRALVLPFMFLWGFPVAAQTVTGTLEGRITDPSGAVMAGADVMAKNSDTALTRVAKTNSSGYFQITFLPVGEYTVTARAPGFGATERKAQVELSSAREVDFELARIEANETGSDLHIRSVSSLSGLGSGHAARRGTDYSTGLRDATGEPVRERIGGRRGGRG